MVLRSADDLRREEASWLESSRVEGGGGGGEVADGAADFGDLGRGYLLLSALVCEREASCRDVVERGRNMEWDVGRGDRATTSLPACLCSTRRHETHMEDLAILDKQYKGRMSE